MHGKTWSVPYYGPRLLRKSDRLYEDAMIAATAVTNGLTVATRNVGDFKTLEVEVFNPFA